MSDKKPSVLFLSSHDSVRGQMAAALLRHHAGDRFEVNSAGLAPTDLHPLTKQVLEEVGVDTTRMEPMRISRFLARAVVNHAIIVCCEGPGCPRMYPFATQTLHWPFEDPSALDPAEHDLPAAFRRLRDGLDARVREWIEELAPAGSGPEVGLDGPPLPILQPGV
jgi:arsenate reductase